MRLHLLAFALSALSLVACQKAGSTASQVADPSKLPGPVLAVTVGSGACSSTRAVDGAGRLWSESGCQGEPGLFQSAGQLDPGTQMRLPWVLAKLPRESRLAPGSGGPEEVIARMQDYARAHPDRLPTEGLPEVLASLGRCDRKVRVDLREGSGSWRAWESCSGAEGLPEPVRATLGELSLF